MEIRCALWKVNYSPIGEVASRDYANVGSQVRFLHRALFQAESAGVTPAAKAKTLWRKP
jgi:hypothetical protein